MGTPMKKVKHLATGSAAISAALLCIASASAATCGNGPGGFESWKREFAPEARAHGIGAAGISALMETNYNSATIAADRGMKSFRLTLDQFLVKRGGAAIVARGRTMKQT